MDIMNKKDATWFMLGGINEENAVDSNINIRN